MLLILAVAGALASTSPAAQSPAALTIAAAPAECARAASVQVWSITRAPATPPPGPAEVFTLKTWLSAGGGPLWVSVAFVDGQKMNDDCRWTFDTPTPGDYVAVIVGAHGSGGSQAFSIRSGEPTSVTIRPPVVTLTGQVQRGGKPAGLVNLRVIAFPFGRPAVTAVTDTEGRYSVTIDRPGLYRVEADRVGAAEATLGAGPNVLNVTGP
jgi:hypothetical protein